MCINIYIYMNPSIYQSMYLSISIYLSIDLYIYARHPARQPPSPFTCPFFSAAPAREG